MSIGLMNVYDPRYRRLYCREIYNLLAEREAHESISHNKMPSWEEHLAFVGRVPYKGWYVIVDIDVSHTDVLGSIYITYANEIGIGVFKKHRRAGIATDAIKLIMEAHPEKFFIANINPANDKSIKLFTEKLGFKHIQNTYRLS